MKKNHSLIMEFGVPNIFKPINFHHLRSLAVGCVFYHFFKETREDPFSDLYASDIATEHLGYVLYYITYIKPDVTFKKMTDVYDAYFCVKNMLNADSKIEKNIIAELIKVQDDDEYRKEIRSKIDRMFHSYIKKMILNLNIKMDHFGKESEYLNDVKKMIQNLLDTGFAEHVNYSILMKQRDHFRFSPLMLKFKDGRYLHAGIDLAVIYHRVKVLKAKKILYFITGKLTTQLSQVFDAAQQVGLPVDLYHIKLGDIIVESSIPIKNPEKLLKVIGRYDADLGFLDEFDRKSFMYDVFKLQNIWDHPQKYITVFADKLHQTKEFQFMKSYALYRKQYYQEIQDSFSSLELDTLIEQCKQNYTLSPLVAMCQEKMTQIQSGIKEIDGINFIHKSMNLLGLGRWGEFSREKDQQ